ncbi:DNA-binding MarR family transcriptional regulator [Deinococcus budaensis]|uniref:DNA-binding MarR family transcriptional regulator n=1 Tax=Deinococcus budaensis TaxID=1665626 RepID=A0A7W8GG13_9DEIO|nr:MarR family winged helix-turn-helix transcriptional regulator [Deinococcus budaensis]MBB5234659.1 DNA-binding MarR family transcriptional regulator [Deinococcus budaensis]
MLVAEAVGFLTERGAAATVNSTAHAIGIDQSGVSRLITSATAAGYLAVQASATDGRRRELTLTPAGNAMLDQTHRWQEEIFLRLSAGWSENRRGEFRQAMTDLMNRSHELEASPTRTPRCQSRGDAA